VRTNGFCHCEYSSAIAVVAGIAMMLVFMLLGLFALVWVIAWLFEGLRFRSEEPGRTRKLAIRTVAGLVAVMLLFPPLRRSGQWVDPESGRAVPMEKANAFDRREFGYIPTYACVVRCFIVDSPRAGGYGLNAIAWKIEWWALLGQIAYTLLIVFPFLAATSREKAPSGC
jgi:hypothetical protein